MGLRQAAEGTKERSTATAVGDVREKCARVAVTAVAGGAIGEKPSAARPVRLKRQECGDPHEDSSGCLNNVTCSS